MAGATSHGGYLVVSFVKVCAISYFVQKLKTDGRSNTET